VKYKFNFFIFIYDTFIVSNYAVLNESEIKNLIVLNALNDLHTFEEHKYYRGFRFTTLVTELFMAVSV